MSRLERTPVRVKHRRTLLATGAGVVALVLAATGAVAATRRAARTDPVAPPVEARTERRAGPVPSTLVPPSPPSAPPTPACVPVGAPGAPRPEPASTDLAATLAERLADPRFAANSASASVWVDGLGEVAALNPDLPLAPASNEKLLTAIGALAILPHDATLVTSLRAGGPVVSAVLTGDLVVVGGGDPTLASRGAHSLDALAAQLAGRGVTTVTGALVADDSRYDDARRAAGWQDWQIPAHTGPLSAFTVDDNRHRADPGYLTDPAIGNAELLRAALARHGIAVAGPTTRGVVPRGAVEVARLESAPVERLVGDMLLHSDNTIADLLLKEVGLEHSGFGSHSAGAAAIDTVLAGHCLVPAGVADDGSGLSRADRRSARELRTILQAVRSEPWFPLLAERLPVAGRSGTLAGRFRGTAAEGTVAAKTGTIIGGVALSGYLTTATGRAAVFSVIVNGDSAASAVPAIDALVASISSATA